MAEEPKWYVVHTYSGYENKVKANIEKIIENRGMHDLIDQVVVPLQDGVEEKNGRRRVVQRKVLPGYVLLKMVMNDDTWYVVRNTRGVTSFVGPGSKPVPLTEDEISAMGIEGGIAIYEIAPGQLVRVIDGPFKDSIGNVEEVNSQKKSLKINLDFLGRETFVELGYEMVEKM